ncbi:hypothetical protein [uncultured Sphingomonas sp.]|uniref:hypothetical protein n=1 Tax=uncultured Sphingomonas sp. TaxID=158754 RepID=UPI0025F9DEEB|nr:hypothetical protein [uncultured Sphingomonas sp.]
MVNVDDIERTIAGHPDDARVSVPVSFLREVARDIRGRDARMAQLAAASAIGDIGGSLAR